MAYSKVGRTPRMGFRVRIFPYLVWEHLNLDHKMNRDRDKKQAPLAEIKGIQQILTSFPCGWSPMLGAGWAKRRNHHEVKLGMHITALRKGRSPAKSMMIQLLTNGSGNNSDFKQTLQPGQTELLPAQSGSITLWKSQLLKGKWSHLPENELT